MISRMARGWVVVSREGHIFGDTIRRLRKEAIDAYGNDDGLSYRVDRLDCGVQVVRCTITTEPPATPATMEEG